MSHYGPLTLTIVLDHPIATSPFTATVFLPEGYRPFSSESTLITAMRQAVEQFRQHLLTTGTDEDALDDGDILVEGIRFAPADGQIPRRFLAEGTYSDYPEGGCFGDWFEAISEDDAEIQARFTMATNENDASFAGDGGRMTTTDFEQTAVYTMFAVKITNTMPDPVTPDEAIALVQRLTAAGDEMLAAFGNCGSPRQQDAATVLTTAVTDGKAAMSAMAAAFPKRHTA